MMDHSWEIIETIIDKVLTLPPGQRKKFIEDECGDSPALKSEVTLLLESIFDSEGWLENPEDYRDAFIEEIADDLKQLNSHHDIIGLEIGSYVIREKLGEGGMGTVYLAERADGAFEHKVAIKVIRQGNATQPNIQRFERERKILASLNHPGIAQLFDGGVTEDGFPYLIMEYIEGEPIVEYCQKGQLTVDERVRLFKKVLKAVRHAHENLIIHRDLKPGNILVNSQGEIKILDFGISKILDDDSPAQLTQTKGRLLTPRYAAPEQIKQQSITTATDLYALGILFYQLLAGRHPFELEHLSQYEMEQKILREEPATPSKMIKRMGLINAKALRGDLDAIALKAIRKEPHHRYRVAGEFLEDLENYEKNLPVSAHKDSARYRSRKFFGRHKKGIGVAAGIFLLMVSFAGFYTWRITEERNEAEFQAQKASQIQQFLIDIFAFNNPESQNYAGRDLTAKELLKKGLQNVTNELRYQPETQIGIMLSIGMAFSNMDEYEQADKALRMALKKSNQRYGPNHLQTASVLSDLALVKRKIGKLNVSDSLLHQAIEIVNKQPNKPLKDLANKYAILGYNQAYRSLYDTARYFLNYADSLYITGGAKNTFERYNTLSNLAEVELRLGKHDNALKHNEEALEFYYNLYKRDHINIATTLGKIGKVYHQMGTHDKADTYFRKALAMKKKLLGENSTSVANTYTDLALNYRVQGQIALAKSYALKELKIMESIYGEDHIKLTHTLNNLGMIITDLGEYKEAERILQKVIDIKSAYYQKNNPGIAVSIYNLAHLYHTTGKYKKAYTLFEQVVQIDKEHLGAQNPEIAIDLNKLGATALEMGALIKADSILTEAKNLFDTHFPKSHYRKAEFFVNYGRLQLRQRQYRKAQNNFKKAVEIFRANFGSKDDRLLEVNSYLEKAKAFLQDS